jgi:hypothetical protein
MVTRMGVWEEGAGAARATQILKVGRTKNDVVWKMREVVKEETRKIF